MSMTMEQIVTELQQELFTLRAQVAAESGLADAVSLSDVKALGRPKELIHWPRGGFPRVVEEDGGILRWCWSGELNRRRKSRRQQLNSSSCRRTRTRTEECKTWSLCRSRCTQHSWLSRVMRRTTLSPTRGRIPLEAWRRLQKRYDPKTGGRKRNLLRTILSSGRWSLLELGVLRVSLREEDEGQVGRRDQACWS